MAGDYDDILAAAVGDEAPRRTRKGALKYQPADTDWSLDRLGELQDFYQSTYKRPLPVTVKGQGSIHNKWGYDHRASADLSLNPASKEGQALVAELQRRRIPFLAFEGAVPGSSTGPHIHVGRPSARTKARYGIGAQVKGSQRKATPAPTPDTYDDVLAAAVGQEPDKPAKPAQTTDTYDDILAAAAGEATPPARQPAQPAQPALDPLLHQLGRINDASDPGAPAGVGELRRIEGRKQREAADTGIGRLRQLDDPAVSAMSAQRKTVEADVRRQREAGPGAVMGSFGRGLTAGFRDPYGAVRDVLAGRDEESSIAREVDQRLQESYQAEERRREITSQFTDRDWQTLNEEVQRLRGKGPVTRGIETGSQRVGSGLLYKLGGLADLVAAAGGSGIANRQFPRTQLGDYLRRQAGRGELTIEQIEAEIPPELSQQFADFLTHATVALPEIIGATAVAGPVGGFAALGGLEATGRKQSFGEVAKETAKGAVLGAVFKGAGAVETLPGRTLGQRAVNTAESGLAIGAGTYAVEKAFGADDYSAARSAASNVFLHAALRVPGEVARFTTAAERALKSPVEEPVPTVPADLQARLARAEEGRPTDTAPLATALKTPTVPPADMTSRPVPAEPVAEPSTAIEPATPSKPALSDLLRERMETGPEPEAINLITGKPVKGRPENEGGFVRVDEIAKAIRKVADTATGRKGERRVEYVLSPPGGRELAISIDIDRRGVARPFIGPQERLRPAEESLLGRIAGEANPDVSGAKPLNLGVDTLLALKRYLMQVHPEITRVEFNRAGSTGGVVGREVKLRPVPRTTPERPAGPAPPRSVDLEAVRTQLARRGLEIRETDAPIPTFAVVRGGREIAKFASADRARALESLDEYAKRGEGQEGHIDLNEIREGLRAGKVRVEEAVERLREKFPNVLESDLKILARREHDPIIGVVGRNGVEAQDNPFRAVRHSDAFGYRPTGERWRYEPAKKTVYWDDPPNLEAKVEVKYYLLDRGLEVKYNENIGNYNPRKLWEEEEAALARPPVHHATQQPRTDTGQFSPGEPGGLEAARSQLRTEARKYATDYKRLDLHLARREGLDIVNDGVARNYFTQLRRLTDEFLPAQSAAVDRAETLYNQGKYSQATMLAESVFRSLPDKVNEYAGADAAIQLTEMGKPSKANWTKTLQEVRERLKRTGGLSGGGSTFYDVNKYPEGGRPDHAKIAYILEPVVDALKMDAQRLIAEGKLAAKDYVAHVRKAVNDMLAREEFADWHPLNKSAALGVLVDKLRQEGPPAGPPSSAPTTEPAQPSQRQRSLPKTLEKSGRDPGTNLTYDRLPNEVVNRRVEGRLEAEGADALETWYRSAPESADRTAAHRVLVDHYTERAISLADTAPQQAESLLAHARELSNLEAERATTLGQAVQLYSNLLKYTAPGVLREVSRLEAQGAKVPAETVQRLVKAAKEAEATDKEVRRLERKLVEAEGQEAPEPVEAATAPPRTAAGRRARRQAGKAAQPEAAEGQPRRYRPRTGAPDTPAERVRRQLDEAAQRRRAQRLAIAAQLRAIEQQRTLGGYWKRSMNITRGLMVSAFSTAMRNLQSQALRFDIERLDDVVEHTIRKSIGLNSDFTYRNIWRNTARQFKFGQTAEAREILSAHEGEYHRMFNTYAGGVDVPIPHPARARIERVFQTVERGVEIANFANRVQEFHVRSAEFLAELDLHLRKEHNQTLEQYVRRNGIDAIPLELVKKATDKALEVTFADMPSKDGAGGRLIGSLIEIGNYIPPTVSPVAFPRFMYNNLKFLYQHSPAGMLDLARRGQNRPRVIARSLVGTSMLLLAYQFRSSDHAGEKWYELKFGDTTLDARPFGPFSTYLFLAEAIRRAKSGEKQFTLDELAQTLGASVLGSGTGTALIEKLYNQISAGEWEKLQRTLKTEGGEWGRALLTPVRQVKDLIGAFDASQAVNRDTSESPFLGPIQESIPYADTNLPPAQLPTTATPIHQERPATKAITGWRAITPKTFLQRQLDELNFTSAEVLPATGNPTLDALQKRLMGPLMDELSTELERDAEFKSMSKKARAVFLRDAIEQIREEVREAAAAEQPELHEQYQEERKPRRTREFEQELNSPGLSRALQLGVPMPIPPRRPGEDDIAYRARLLQVGRQRRSRLDSVAGQLGSLDRGSQRSLLHNALYRG